jgi:hypothetical protein
VYNAWREGICAGLGSALGLTLRICVSANSRNEFVDADFETQNPLSHHCRLWAMVAASVAEEVVLDHLVNLLYSLKNLGASNDGGWGLAYYNSLNLEA